MRGRGQDMGDDRAMSVAQRPRWDGRMDAWTHSRIDWQVSCRVSPREQVPTGRGKICRIMQATPAQYGSLRAGLRQGRVSNLG